MFSTIREWVMEDALNVASALNNKKIQDNLRDGLPYPYTLEDAEIFIRTMQGAPKDSQYAFAISLEGDAVGSIAVTRQQNIHRFTGELGYYLAEPYWGKGIITKAIKETCKYIFDHTDLVRIYATPFAWNTASCRVLEKAGFTLEGVMRESAFKQDRYVDMKLYALIKEEYFDAYRPKKILR